MALAALAAAATAAAALGDVPATMRAVRKTGALGCGPPDFGCVSVQNRTTPTPGRGEVLIRVAGSSVNPDEISILSTPVLAYSLGIDVSGTVAAVGAGCKRLKVGDAVWTMAPWGGMSEYTNRVEDLTGLAPTSVDIAAAGTLPTVAMTSLGALEAAGAPWPAAANATVLIVAGTGGTGYTAVQIAKAMGAATVVCAATGDGIPFAKSLGCDIAVDYKTASVFDAVPDGSVDVVYNNHDSAGNGDRAMPKMKAGGVYVTVGGGDPKSPPPGVKVIDYSLADAKEVAGFIRKLDTLAGFVDDGKIRVVVQKAFGFSAVRDALATEAKGEVMSKLEVSPLL